MIPKGRATVTKRDDVANVVMCHLSGHPNDQRTAYVLMLNPLGIQQDGVFAEGATRYSVAWSCSQRNINQRRYTIEMACLSARSNMMRRKIMGHSRSAPDKIHRRRKFLDAVAPRPLR
jgi:hypothetical protein